ncbi:MAG: DUF4143 domain-containing protein [Rickettsia endosymbiont of Graphium doson]|nr:DUF4143 domain-containing protein [Rickettsia endosymbiont of Graphium doson]
MGSKKNRQIYLSKRIISKLYILRFIKNRFTRTKTGLEVDFIINTVRGNKILPIEVKISENIHNSELRAIKSFMEEHQVNKGWHCCVDHLCHSRGGGNPEKIINTANF